MRIFVTGATGGIGSVVVTELITAGHEVLGLARSDASAQALSAVGASAWRGDLGDPQSLRVGASRCDGVIHLAFGNDVNNFAKCVEEEALAVETFGAALEGSGKALVIASGTPAVPGRASSEADPAPTEGPVGGRGRNANTVLNLADRGVRSAVVRLPGRSTLRASVADSRRCSSMPPARTAYPATSVTVGNAGRPCIASTLPGSSGSSSNKVLLGRWRTRWPMRATRCGRSPR